MSATLDGTHHPVVVIGGGQAGLAMSACLSELDIDHVVLEKHRVGHEWRERRWDSFCLVTPNWQCQLPGFPYQGADADGFMVRDDIVGYLESYREHLNVPIHEGVEASLLRPHSRGFELRTNAGTLTAGQVVLATGPYQVPRIPRAAERLPDHIVSLHSSQYRNADVLPEGAVLVVGTGQSGCQIAEDLYLAGRTVHLATGSAPRVARRYRGRDVVAWLEDMGYYRKTIEDFDDADAVRFRVNHYVTGRDGGRDIDLRAFARDGMRLYGRLLGISNGFVSFGTDLKANLDAADAVSESIKDSIDAYIAAAGVEAPTEARYVPVWEPSGDETRLDLAGVSTVIWSTGFGRDHRWIEVPVFDGRGYPTQTRGVTACPGLYFLGLPWQWTWGSGRFCGVGPDAAHLAWRIQELHRGGRGAEVRWLTGAPAESRSRFADGESDEDWVAPRTVA
ncbi:MAG TPA: MSMEG_0569 family flavin-dependent oxidoreductase [Sporichthyaceae bacterium]|nr:MSMEG_0569 family flavin-dependent oxidoreductase [Sporichthyaceae bacterium]